MDGNDRWAISVSGVGRRLGISRAHAYRLVASGEIPSVRPGHRTVVPLQAIDELLGGSSGRRPPLVVSGRPGPVDTSGASASGGCFGCPSLVGGAKGGARC
jgi:excisionase family DNA binding protein